MNYTHAQKTPLSIAITAAILMSGNVYASDPAVNNDAVNIKDLDQEIFNVNQVLTTNVSNSRNQCGNY